LTETKGEIIELDDSSASICLPQRKNIDLFDVALSGVLSEHSRRAYQTGLRCFAIFLLERAERPVPKESAEIMEQAAALLPYVDFHLITEYREHLRKKKMSANTINLRLSAVNALYKRMQRLELIKENPASPVMVARMRAPSVSNTDGLSHAEAEALLQACACDRSLKGQRDLALISLMLHNGLRRREVISIDAEKFKFVGDTPTYLLTVKGSKQLAIEIVPQVWAEIEKWMKMSEIEEGPLFRSMHRSKSDSEKVLQNRLTTKGVYVIILARTKEAGISKRIHPHSLRHTFATLALLSGVHIQDLQIAMGHSSTNTTFRYYRAVDQIGRSPGRRINLSWQG